MIVTGWGGTPKFLPRDYPYLVDYDLLPTIDEPPDAWWEPRPGERWARARIAHGAQLLRRVYEERDAAAAWGGVLRSGMSTTYSESRVTDALIEALTR